jgi:NAD(P)-dependent dehydrogenase (short-subunit alcohol dehydrogenase family)/rhamnose utilization protein RhaD (predicted bifunctional aldolase and dehydrogenase)
MKKEILDLIEVSQHYGKKKSYVVAGGGNTSWKDGQHLYIKASGVNLATIGENGFCILDRTKLDQIAVQEFAADSAAREEEVKNALLACRVNPESGLRPSVETSLHNLFGYAYVVHVHPTLVNALLCSREAGEKTASLFGGKALYIPYSDPGFSLFTIIRDMILKFRKENNHDPHVVFIQNHGIFVAANSIDEIHGLFHGIETRLKSVVKNLPETDDEEVSDRFAGIVPAVRMMLSAERPKVARAFKAPVITRFTEQRSDFDRISTPFTPDQIVYCLSEYLYIENSGTQDAILEEADTKIRDFRQKNGVVPKVIFVRGEGVIVADDSALALNYLHDLVLDFCQIASISENFGGPHPMTSSQIAFIENWEVENYRKMVSLGTGSKGRVEHKVVVITGGAQGFGAGIARLMYEEGADVVVADLNREKGQEFVEELNSMQKMNRALFVPVNVADADSVKQMIKEVVLSFGGVDVMISNAGILRAGGIDEMTPETFELMTKVNYSAFFYCVKYAGSVMKLQHKYNPGYYMDIIQINSKSGLKGSNKNFAYAGGKFGGIGLTQSFALELMPFNIKVNAVCPGNFFDGPLWADPQNGLFVQYLRAGKIPGAISVDDVKRYYEKQVPAGRGCTEKDVVKAIYYIIEQEYETGQAVPVTGGQEMLS